jgi:hypothetical protein
MAARLPTPQPPRVHRHSSTSVTFPARSAPARGQSGGTLPAWTADVRPGRKHYRRPVRLATDNTFGRATGCCRVQYASGPKRNGTATRRQQRARVCTWQWPHGGHLLQCGGHSSSPSGANATRRHQCWCQNTVTNANSGWLPAQWLDASLSPNVRYGYRVKARTTTAWKRRFPPVYCYSALGPLAWPSGPSRQHDQVNHRTLPGWARPSGLQLENTTTSRPHCGRTTASDQRRRCRTVATASGSWPATAIWYAPYSATFPSTRMPMCRRRWP